MRRGTQLVIARAKRTKCDVLSRANSFPAARREAAVCRVEFRA
jgi:hypothetical protein